MRVGYAATPPRKRSAHRDTEGKGTVKFRFHVSNHEEELIAYLDGLRRQGKLAALVTDLLRQHHLKLKAAYAARYESEGGLLDE